MSTNSRIGYINDKGSITHVHCQWDGHIETNGKTLFENYKTLPQVIALVSGGDMSSLGEKCDKPAGHSYATPVDGYTVYYGRDRGEDGVDPQVDESIKDFLYSGDEYNYLFQKGKWYVSIGNEGLKLLTANLIKKAAKHHS